MKNINVIAFSFVTTVTLLFYNCTGNNGDTAEPHETGNNLYIGWASTDITPDEPVLLRGQFHARISEGVKDPVTVTALAIESGDGSTSERVIMISCDLVAISDGIRDGKKDISLMENIRKQVTKTLPELNPGQIIINATHTHSAPFVSPAKDVKEIYGVELDVMTPYACQEYVSKRIAKVANEAWINRKHGGISYGLGHAVTGHNRLSVNMSGKSSLYGNINNSEFSHIEGFEDHSVNLVYTWDKNSELTGIIINTATPAQVSEQEYLVSADYWHDLRVELRNRLGKDIFILPQCSAAGDQSPHLMVGKKAEERMQQLISADSLQTGWGSMGRRNQIAISISNAVTSVLPFMRDNIEWDPTIVHKMEIVDLSRRLLGMDDVNKALEEAEKWREKYELSLTKIKENPEIKKNPRWYKDVTIFYSRMMRGYSVQQRYELEQKQPNIPIEIHALRIGDMVMATNPFELYLDYGIRIKGRSPATQTFLIQLTGGGSYLPTTRSVEGGSYGSVPASTLVGTKGGQEFVDKTLELINSVWTDH